MSRILIVFSSIDGQTARIADRIGGQLALQGHAVTQLPLGAPGLAEALDSHDAVVIGGAIRYGHHARALERWIRDRSGSIAARANAFFSVSLSAGGPGAKPAVAAGYIDALRRSTGWQPERIATFAGALRYRKYNPFIRWLMRFIVGKAGGETDMSQDYEYTDWKAVDAFARDFAARGPRVD